jgi:hypothetical protein
MSLAVDVEIESMDTAAKCHESDVPPFFSTHSQPVMTLALMDIQTDTINPHVFKDISIILERVVLVV